MNKIKYFPEYFLRLLDNNFHRFIDTLNAYSPLTNNTLANSPEFYFEISYIEKKRIHHDRYKNFHLKFPRKNWNKQIIIDRIVDRKKRKNQPCLIKLSTFKIPRGGKNWEYKRYPRRRCIKMGISTGWVGKIEYRALINPSRFEYCSRIRFDYRGFHR